ncbi:hypothetical protein PSCICN_47990 [Pseudomonas cichorii]|nr:hypothetical protein PSCICN_47990 [Pseudomonas cichorii]
MFGAKEAGAISVVPKAFPKLQLGLRWSNGTKHRVEHISPDTKAFEGSVPQSVLEVLGLK